VKLPPQFSEASGISPFRERTFWSRVVKSEPRACWLWQGGKWANGYGMFSIGGSPYLAHRIAWMIKHKSSVPAGKRVILKCRNRLCCNPAHLRLGTHKNHAAKGNRSGRRTKPEAWFSKSDSLFEFVNKLSGVNTSEIADNMETTA